MQEIGNAVFYMLKVRDLNTRIGVLGLKRKLKQLKLYLNIFKKEKRGVLPLDIIKIYL